MKKNPVYFVLLIQSIASILVICFFNGTYDAGDSIVHYLFARYAPHHPQLYFDHWAKPVFVLLASPFAQAGFTGMKIFNVLVSLGNTWFTYKTAEALKIRNAWMAALIMLFAPLNFILSFTGFTEPLFALFTVLAIYFCCRRNFISASILISFLPYVRSEGLIIIGVFILYFIVKRNFRSLPLLFFGSLVYAIAGYFVYHDFLWVFTKIPYATMKSVYGHGTLTHFAEQMLYVLGIPLCILFWIGFVNISFQAFRKKLSSEVFILIFLGFGAFFTAHTLFWYLGIFNSFGLKRVLIGVMPLAAIIVLYGYNYVVEELWKKKNKIQLVFKYALLTYILIFPITPNPAAIEWHDDFCLGQDQEAVYQMAAKIKSSKKVILPLVYNHHSLSMAFDNDYFDREQHSLLLHETLKQMKTGQILIWDNQSPEKNEEVSAAELESRTDLQMIGSFTVHPRGSDVIFLAYKKVK